MGRTICMRGWDRRLSSENVAHFRKVARWRDIPISLIECDCLDSPTSCERAHFASARSAPQNSDLRARSTHRTSRTVIARSTATMAAAQYGCRVANQVRNTANPSSPKLSAKLENGSGEAVTAARTAVLPPWAAKAMAPPAAAAANCSQGDRAAVGGEARSAATGMRIKVCSAFQIRSKAGILSAKNSMAKSAPLAAITYQLATRSKTG